MEWWDQVTVNPQEIRIIVFIRGISNGLKGWIYHKEVIIVQFLFLELRQSGRSLLSL